MASLTTLEAAMNDQASFWAGKIAKPVEPVKADLTEVPSYSVALGAPYSPRATVAHMADQLEASGVAIVREDYGFRTATPAEKAARAEAPALLIAAEAA